MQIKVIPNGVFMVNTIIVFNENTGDATLIDPGDDAESIAQLIEKNQFDIRYVMATHAHIDHVYSAAKFCKRFNLPFYIPEKDKALLKGVSMQAAMFGLSNPELPEDIRYLTTDETKLPFNEFPFEIIHTPGHSPGSLCLRYENILISGDTLFYESIGRTDLPGGNMEEILSSINEKLFILDDETVVYPGHGEPTSIGHEKKHNLFTGSRKF